MSCTFEEWYDRLAKLGMAFETSRQIEEAKILEKRTERALARSRAATARKRIELLEFRQRIRQLQGALSS